jgi:hypothetical protein
MEAVLPLEILNSWQAYSVTFQKAVIFIVKSLVIMAWNTLR